MSTNPAASVPSTTKNNSTKPPPSESSDWCGRSVCQFDTCSYLFGAALIVTAVVLFSLQNIVQYNFFNGAVVAGAAGGCCLLLGCLVNCCKNIDLSETDEAKTSKIATKAKKVTEPISKEVTAKAFFEAEGIFGLPKKLLDEVTLWRDYRLGKKVDIDFDAGILLHGPSGTGKTTIAKAVAKFIGGSYYEIRSGDLKDPYYGNTEKKITALFTVPEDEFRIIFIDEVTGIFPKRNSSHEVSREVVDHILGTIDGTPKKEPKALVLAATNNFDNLDGALLRPGRLGSHFLIDLPNDKTRKELFDHHLKNSQFEGDIEKGEFAEELVKLTEGKSLSGAQIVGMVNEAKKSAYHDGERALRKADFKIPKASDYKTDGVEAIPLSTKTEDFFEEQGIFDVPQDLILELNYWRQFRNGQAKELDFEAGLILTGPDPSGLFALAQAIALLLGGKYHCLRNDEFQADIFNQRENVFKRLFESKDHFSVIAIEEIDSIFPKALPKAKDKTDHLNIEYFNGATHVVSKFIDKDSKKSPRFLAIGLTSDINMVSDKIQTPGRLSTHFTIPLPSLATCEKIIRFHLKDVKLSEEEGWDSIIKERARAFEGRTSFEIRTFVNEAKKRAALESRPLKQKDFFGSDLT